MGIHFAPFAIYLPICFIEFSVIKYSVKFQILFGEIVDTEINIQCVLIKMNKTLRVFIF